MVEPGGVVEFRAEVPLELRRIIGGGNLSSVTNALVALAVPKSFDAARSWPILIVSATSDAGLTQSRRALRNFVAPALAAGWVVVAADPAEPLANADEDTNLLRYGLIKAALSALATAWPDAAQWPVAFGGFSGGSKRSEILAFIATLDGRPPIGLFLGGCNEAPVELALRKYREPLPALLRAPVFLSSGTRDDIATPAQHRDVERALLDAGFTDVRLETYPGRHELSHEQVRTALDWFSQRLGGRKP
jgi:hypothetical protein